MLSYLERLGEYLMSKVGKNEFLQFAYAYDELPSIANNSKLANETVYIIKTVATIDSENILVSGIKEVMPVTYDTLEHQYNHTKRVPLFVAKGNHTSQPQPFFKIKRKKDTQEDNVPKALQVFGNLHISFSPHAKTALMDTLRQLLDKSNNAKGIAVLLAFDTGDMLFHGDIPLLQVIFVESIKEIRHLKEGSISFVLPFATYDKPHVLPFGDITQVEKSYSYKTLFYIDVAWQYLQKHTINLPLPPNTQLLAIPHTPEHIGLFDEDIFTLDISHLHEILTNSVYFDLLFTTRVQTERKILQYLPNIDLLMLAKHNTLYTKVRSKVMGEAYRGGLYQFYRDTITIVQGANTGKEVVTISCNIAIERLFRFLLDTVIPTDWYRQEVLSNISAWLYYSNSNKKQAPLAYVKQYLLTLFTIEQFAQALIEEGEYMGNNTIEEFWNKVPDHYKDSMKIGLLLAFIANRLKERQGLSSVMDTPVAKQLPWRHFDIRHLRNLLAKIPEWQVAASISDGGIFAKLQQEAIKALWEVEKQPIDIVRVGVLSGFVLYPEYITALRKTNQEEGIIDE